MQTSSTKKIKYHHNGDFSGEIVLIVPEGQVEVTGGKAFVEISFDDIREIYIHYLTGSVMTRLEDLNVDEIESRITVDITPFKNK